ncbi:TolC family protein, partial [Paracidovorax cattleyae]|uniref:TolC family protein n=1 Tax=Paracidovorax cattleyae TaxID=80868 RepID=UPI00336A709F
MSVHSSLGTQGGFSDGELAAAAAAIIAADMPVDRQDLLGTASAPVHEAAPHEVLADAERVVRAALARAQAAQASLDGANALRKSDWTVGTSIDHFPGTSTRQVELRLQMPLQWGYQYQGEIGRAQADYAKAQDALDNTRRLALLDLQRLRQTQESAARRAADYDQGVLPRARQVADSAELAYRKGAIALTDL